MNVCMNVGMALIVLLSASALSESKDSRIGDDYAKAALRAVIYLNESGITPERTSFLLDEADVEASTPAEEASFKELNRILGIRIRRPATRPSKPTLRRVTALRPRRAGKIACCFTRHLTVVGPRGYRMGRQRDQPRFDWGGLGGPRLDSESRKAGPTSARSNKGVAGVASPKRSLRG